MTTESVLLGKRITEARRARGWKKADLARRAGVHASYVTRIEQGRFDRPSIDLVKALATALGISVTDLAEPPRPPAPADVTDAAARIAEHNPRLARSVLEEIASRSPEEQAAALRLIEAVLGYARGSFPQTGHATGQN